MNVESIEVAGLLWGARELRGRLEAVAGEDAAELGEAIDALLSRAVAAPWGGRELASVADDLVALLSGHPGTRAWMREFHERELADRLPAAFEPVPGKGTPVPPAERYKCTICGFTWARRSAGQVVPNCPKDGSSLDRVDGT